MLASRTVCAQCRSKLLASAASIGTARSSSTANFPSVAAEHTSKTTSQPAHPHTSDPNPRPNPRKQNNKGDTDAKRRTLDLFESAIKKSEEQTVPETTQDVNQLYHLTNRLEKVLSNRKISDVEAATACYALLAREAVPALRAAGGKIPQHLHAKAGHALRRIAETKLSVIREQDLPSLSDICKLHADMGRLQPSRRLQLINAFLEAIVTNASGESIVDEGDAIKIGLLDDVVEFWKHFSGLRRTNSGLGYETKFWLTSRPDLRAIENPVKLFWMLFPPFVLNELDGLAPALVTTYVLLSDPAHEQTKAKEEARPLLEALEHIVKRFDRKRLQPLFELHPGLWEYIEPRADWRVIQVAPNAWKNSSASSADSSNPKPGRFSYALWHKRFNMAYRGNDHVAVQQAWRDLVNPSNDNTRAEKLRDCPELFDYILHISCHKSRFEKTIYTQVIQEVLQYMKRLGLEPTIRTWTSMMEGWKQAKRIEPIEHLWDSITKAGFKLDRNIWSSRISALGSLGSPWDGIKALTHMERAWQEAVKEGRQAGAVQPGIANVNAAISGLLWRDRMDAVYKVLQWATERGLEPDIYTYNMLLRRMLKKGTPEEADRILGSMKAAGITPDGATFTIIIEAALANLWRQTPQEQKAAIKNVFNEMAACGIEPNQEAYAKMLHTLIKEGDIARTSIATVLAHMRSNNIQPSTEICTILVEYFVSREQPDLESIRVLVADRRSRTRALTDRVFWETVVKHYHRAGELESALEIVYDLDDWGIWPGLALLEPLLRSLGHREDWDAARKLVATVRRQPRPDAADPDSRFWKHAFWGVAKDYDLIDSNAEVVQSIG